MLDLNGLALNAEERDLLEHPLIGGVILFQRNYESPEQLIALTDSIKALRPNEPLLIAVDQEGGRVQRFQQSFTRLPALRTIGALSSDSTSRCGDTHEGARKLAQDAAWLMASELLACGLDFSFAPVLDVDHGVSQVISDRSFHADPAIVAELGIAYRQGMRQAGMASVAKHFPGHGAVRADSHTDFPIDKRKFSIINQKDAMPFLKLIKDGIEGVMASHVIYPQADGQPAVFSNFWLNQVLRENLGFQGAIFSDDLTMKAATVIGDEVTRAQTALRAGADMVLICNNRDGALAILDNLSWHSSSESIARLQKMRSKVMQGWSALMSLEKHQNIARQLSQI